MASRDGHARVVWRDEVSRELREFDHLAALDERQRRLPLGAAARALGLGGVRRSPARQVSASDWSRARRELESARAGCPGPPAGRAASRGERIRGWCAALLALVEPDQRGYPGRRCGGRRIHAEARGRADPPGPPGQLGHRRRAAEGRGLLPPGQLAVHRRLPAPGPRRPVRYINAQVHEHGPRHPVISVDAKKKERSASTPAGASSTAGQPGAVRVTTSPTDGRAQGGPVRHLRPGRQHRGWRGHRPRHRRVRRGLPPPLVARGLAPLPAATLLITATPAAPTATARGRGRPSSPISPWPPAFVTVCHFPPVTSKWNKIQHRLFSHISINWRGPPLTSHESSCSHRRDPHPARAQHPRRARPRHLPHRSRSATSSWHLLPWTRHHGTAPGTTPCTRARCPARPPRPRPPRARPLHHHPTHPSPTSISPLPVAPSTSLPAPAARQEAQRYQCARPAARPPEHTAAPRSTSLARSPSP